MKYNNTLSSDRFALASAVLDTLHGAGFTLVPANRLPSRTREDVYEREVTRSGRGRIVVQVWTSIEGGYMRSAGKDAIRVATVFINDNGTQRGCAKERRVNRTGDINAIAERMLGRMRDAWRGVKTIERCGSCGSPEFTSKKKNTVCAALCWK
jgi:hypothetical protein